VVQWIIYIGDVILTKTSVTATEYVLALATLGNATKNRNNPILCRAAQGGQGKYCFVSLALALSRILRQWKHGLRILQFGRMVSSSIHATHNKLGCFKIQ
jgi:hypothetical protein